jgi:hypothetical protein
LFRVIFFLWVYGFSLGVWFFLWVYVGVFPLGLCLCFSFQSALMFFLLKSTSVAFLQGNGIHMIFQVGIYGNIEEERCTSHIGPGRSCGCKKNFSPPLPLSLAEDCAMATVQKNRNYGDRLGDWGERRYSDSEDGQRYRESTFGRPCGR